MRLKAQVGSKFILAAAVATGLQIAPARADDSLWGKALGAVGLGSTGSGSTGTGGGQTANTPAPAPVQATQKLPDVSVNAAPKPAPAQPDNGNFFSKWFGGGSSNPPAPAPVEPQRRAMEPTQAPAPQQVFTPAPEPSLWDKMLGSAGMPQQSPLDVNDYSQRPKLAVPKDRNLPAPAPAADPRATRSVDSSDLTKPPGNYLDKAVGSDGSVSGLRDVDVAKDKKFFGLF